MAWNTGTGLAPANSIFFCQFCVHICLHLCRHQIPLCHGIYSNWVMSLITMMILHRLPKTSKWTDYSSSTLPYRSATISWLPPSNWNIRFLWWLPPILWSRMLTYNYYIFPTQLILLYNLHFMLIPTQDHLFRPIMYYATQPFSVNKYATSKMNSADYFDSALHLLPLVPPFNTLYLGLGRTGLHAVSLAYNAESKRQTSISGLSPLPNNSSCSS